MGHKMLHVHSDDRGEQDRYSSEILSSGLTAGFSLTDRVKGMQKGDGKPGTQWLMYSLSQMFRLKVLSTVLSMRALLAICRMRAPGIYSPSKMAPSPCSATRGKMQKSHV